MDFPQQQLQVNGIIMNVVIAGEGPDVLLVHGFPDNHTVWRKTIPALVEAGYRVIAPDTRGCGGSELLPNKSDYKLVHLIADLKALLDHLSIPKVRLVAHDWGAVIAWQFVLEHPEMVDRYVALSVGHPHAYATGPIEQKLKGYYVLLFQLRGIFDWMLKRGNWWLFRRLTHYPEETPHWIEALSRPGRLTAAMDYYRANIGVAFRRDPRKAKVPVMGVWSDGDRFLAEKQMTDCKDLVKAPFRYERVEGANHWLQLSAPGRVNALLLDYLK